MSDEAELRHTLRDVLGLMALPAVWRRKSPAEILQVFAQALEVLVQCDVVLALATTDPQVMVCRRAGQRDDALAEPARAWFAPCFGPTSSQQRLPCGELEVLTVVCEPLGYGAAQGHVVVARAAPGFPSSRDLVVIKAATTLVTNALEMARALEEREAALLAKDDFLALLGHELRNPLAPIVTALDLLQQRNQGFEEREEQVLRRQVEHVRRLVDDLLDVSKVARSKLVLQKTTVPLAQVVADALEATAPVFQEYEHELSVSIPDSAVFVDADAVRLAQAIGNVLINAAKYTPRRGRVQLAATVEGDLVSLTVRDNGIGIDPELMPHIFEKFVQGKPNANRKHSGLGIGLSLVRVLIEMHGGTVTARSPGQGKGTELTLTLPVSNQRVRLPAPAAKQILPSRVEGRVLIVDDNQDAVELLGAALETIGYTVRTLTDPLEALAAVAEFRPDVGILDIGMPGMDGYELCAAIRQRSPDLPLIALTGYGRDSDKERARAAGFSSHAAKPVQLAALVEQLQSLVDGAH